jgi:acetyl esterase/lipase
MNSIRAFLALCMALLATACTSVDFAVVNLPTHFSDVQVTRDVAFGPAAWQKLDIYRPASAPASEKLPVIVFYYGGRWEEGTKEQYRFVGNVLARQNYVVVIADYRKYPEVRFPVFVNDAAESLAWTYDHIDQYGGRPDEIHLAGHSAGAHIASLLATDARYLKALGKDRSVVIQDFVGLAGPYDFTPDDEDLKKMFGPPSQYPQMQATTFIDGHQPPMLLLWGAKDQYVGRQNIDRMEAAVHARGGCIETKIYPDLDHVWLLANLSWLGSSRDDVLQDWMRFIAHGQCGPDKP